MSAPVTRVGLWGYGREGRAARAWLAARSPDAVVVVADDDPRRVAASDPDVTVVPFAALREVDEVWVSPGVRPSDPRRAELTAAGVRLVTGTNVFLERAAARTVGVTGTKGKSTTATFVHALLTGEGEPARLGGNIGRPLVELLDPATGEPAPGEVFVAELSSYQCADLQRSPRIAAVTQLHDDHLLEHGSRAAYWGAKARIVTAGGAAALVATPETVDRLRAATGDALGGVRVVTPPPAADLPGGLAPHVTENLAVAAAAAAAFLGRDLTPGTVEAVARAHRPLPHRQVTVSEALGVRWVDDALATTQESALAALAAHPGERVALLLGGRDRGQPIDRLAAALARRPGVRVLLVGETAGRFGADLAAAGVPAQPVGTVEAGVAAVAAAADDVDVCLLSPAAASYDQFRDHAAKGAAFLAAVERAAGGRP